LLQREYSALVLLTLVQHLTLALICERFLAAGFLLVNNARINDPILELPKKNRRALIGSPA
jgi:hypothetical protein